jgi:hypothetical protein
MAAQICETCRHKGKECYCAPNSTCEGYEPRAITNFEKIKLMSIDEMKTNIYKYAHNICNYCIYSKGWKCTAPLKTCVNGIKQWLEEEVEE